MDNGSRHQSALSAPVGWLAIGALVTTAPFRSRSYMVTRQRSFTRAALKISTRLSAAVSRNGLYLIQGEPGLGTVMSSMLGLFL